MVALARLPTHCTVNLVNSAAGPQPEKITSGAKNTAKSLQKTLLNFSRFLVANLNAIISI